jgi:predicted lipoprotein with Yx(FWY)xxD motif
MIKQRLAGATVISMSLLIVGCANAYQSSDDSQGYSSSHKHASSKVGVVTQQTPVGSVLADTQGMTLYTFDKDSQGVSKCYGPCEQKWPPLQSKVEIDEMGFSTVSRKDGSLQVRYKNQPLYLWIGDKKPGDTTGDGIKGVWHIVPVAK